MRLLAATAEYGRNWSVIVEKAFPARSPTDIKNRYASYSKTLQFPNISRSCSHVILERKQKQALSLSKIPATPLSPSPSSSEIPSSTVSELAQIEMSIDSDSWSRQDLSFYGFDGLDGTDLFHMDSGSDHFSISIPPSLETGPSSDFSTPSCFPLLDFDEGDHFPDGTRDILPPQQTPTPLSNNAGSDLDLLLDTDDFSIAHDGIEPTSNAIDRHARSTVALDPTDLSTAAGSGAATTQSDQRNTLILEDLEPETVNKIMTTLFRSNTKVKMRLYSQD